MRFLSSSIGFVLLAACGASPGTHPSDMTATEHRAEARRHDRDAARAPYYRGSYWGGYGHGYSSGYSHGYYPWAYSWDPGSSHYAEAQEHEDAATVLEKRYRKACALVDPKAAASEPFARFVTTINLVENGVTLQLKPEAGPPDLLLAEIQCHSAWLQLTPRVEAANDISGLTGLGYTVLAEPAGIMVTITIRGTSPDPAAVTELRRRAELLVQPRDRTTSNR